MSVKKIMYVKKNMFWNPSTCICENGKYLASITDDSVITCDEVIESYYDEIKIIPISSNEKNITWKTKSFCIILIFLLITIALLTAVSIYCYLIKYQAKQKHLLPLCNTKLK